MEFLSALWMPIVVSAVLVWIASFITHMVLPHHKSEFGAGPNEDEFLNTMQGVPPGLYMFPHCTMKEMNTPEHKAKRQRGPIGLMAIWAGDVNMGQNLGLTLLFYIVVGVFVGYLGWHTIIADADYMARFRICGTVAFCAHGLGWIPMFLWYRYGKFWPNMFDSVLYALVTAGTFAAFWPK